MAPAKTPTVAAASGAQHDKPNDPEFASALRDMPDSEIADNAEDMVSALREELASAENWLQVLEDIASEMRRRTSGGAKREAKAVPR